MPSGRQAHGAGAEQLAADWYEVHGDEVVEGNWRCERGEIDLIAGRGGLLVV